MIFMINMCLFSKGGHTHNLPQEVLEETRYCADGILNLKAFPNDWEIKLVTLTSTPLSSYPVCCLKCINTKTHIYYYLFWDCLEPPAIYNIVSIKNPPAFQSIRSGAQLNFYLHTILGEHYLFALIPQVPPPFRPPPLPPADSFSCGWRLNVIWTCGNHQGHSFSAYNQLKKKWEAVRRAESFRTNYWNMMWSPRLL